MQEKKKKSQYTAWSNYRLIYSELWKYDKKIIFYSLAEMMFHILFQFGAILMPALVIAMLEQRLPLEKLIGGILLLFAGYGVVVAIDRYLTERNFFQYIGYRCMHMEMKYLWKVGTLDYFQYEKEENQKLSAKAEEAFWGNNWGIEGILHNDVLIVSAVGSLILYAQLIAEVSPWIVWMLVLISLVQVISFRLANRYELKNKDEKTTYAVTQSYLNQQAYEASSGKDVRLYQLQHWLSSKYQSINRKYQRLVAKERSCYFANDLLGLLLQFGRDIICYGYLIYMLKNGMTVSKFVLYIGIVAGFSTYFSTITEKITENVRNQKMVGYFREFMELEQEFHHGEGTVLAREDVAIEVEFSHVSFSYPGSDKKILDDISFTMKKGERTALVGMNGAGKSTIVKLLCGFYMPDAGHIYLNGVDMSELDLEEYYKELAVVFQDSFLYSFSIADNVACSLEENYDRESCIAALKRAGLWEKVNSLKEQERTYLNKDVREDGIQLSGGEKQKLMMARALYKKFRLLLLDEPTAALDAIAESELYEKYGETIADKTALFISHRLASTRFCHQILFLENGKIKEQGTHEELMQLQGEYAHMFEVQSKYYREGKENECEADMA